MNNVQQQVAMSYQRDKEQKKTDIQQAFTELINTNGYDKTTIRQIAKKADISVGIIYHYYPQGKPSIAAAIYEKNLRETIPPYGLTENIDEVLRNHIQSHRENSEMYKAFDQAILADHDVFESIKRDRRQIMMEYLEEKDLPVELLDRWLTTYNVIDAVIHKHLYINSVCEKDPELINLLRTIYSAINS
ncbi:MAG: TetR/AcrR family transcriptional regulator [Candidatus Bathyarchaeota archaeon]|nr:TetR/AcrR family transcriptional regulator [Candidatus Bathyarchaeota archaeon]